APTGSWSLLRRFPRIRASISRNGFLWSHEDRCFRGAWLTNRNAAEETGVKWLEVAQERQKVAMVNPYVRREIHACRHNQVILTAARRLGSGHPDAIGELAGKQQAWTSEGM